MSLKSLMVGAGLAAIMAGCATSGTEVKRLTLSERYACDHQREVRLQGCEGRAVRVWEENSCESDYRFKLIRLETDREAAERECKVDAQIYGSDAEACLKKAAEEHEPAAQLLKDAYDTCLKGVEPIVAKCKADAEKEYKDCLEYFQTR